MTTLIVGQGLAGTTLAHRLLARNESVYIVDDNHAHSSSMVAAGLWNPIVFKRMNKSWMADSFLESMSDFYPNIEQLIGHSFYHPKAIYRMHGSNDEYNLWQEKKSLPGYKSYLHHSETPQIAGFARSEFGSGEVNFSGYVDVRTYLEKSAAYFETLGIFKKAKIEWPVNQNSIGELTFDGMTMNRIVDCRGAQSESDQCWQFLPFNPTKGEVLTIHAPGFKFDHIFNAGFFVLPLGEDNYRVGATFEWKNLDEIPTDEGRKSLESKLRKWTDLPFEIVDHKAGVRPTVKDRRPFVGRHPNHPNFYIINGMGAKGVMMAPYLSQAMADFICDEVPLNPEIDIARFFQIKA